MQHPPEQAKPAPIRVAIRCPEPLCLELSHLVGAHGVAAAITDCVRRVVSRTRGGRACQRGD